MFQNITVRSNIVTEWVGLMLLFQERQKKTFFLISRLISVCLDYSYSVIISDLGYKQYSITYCLQSQLASGAYNSEVDLSETKTFWEAVTSEKCYPLPLWKSD